jgi:hypothetical protein
MALHPILCLSERGDIRFRTAQRIKVIEAIYGKRLTIPLYFV